MAWQGKATFFKGIKMDETKPSFQRSPDTELLIKSLRSEPVGSRIKYEMLMQISNRPTLNYLRGILGTAIKCLEGEGIFYATIREFGIQRITESESLGQCQDRRVRASRLAKRSKRCLAAIENEAYACLSTEDKARWNSEMLLASIQERAGQNKTSERLIETAKVAPQHKLDIGSVLDLMKK